MDLRALLAAAQATFADLEAQPLTFTATELVWLRKAGPGAVYLPVEAWPLGAGRVTPCPPWPSSASCSPLPRPG
ncbi:hypothetical protein [Deinococcus multiflagellatus]|uniref:Uncharacterized protein n=1 Tax=Deinococcus multiflagellatus TaxID=1656887 RepID=A0ABW1ZNU5_9DEIO